MACCITAHTISTETLYEDVTQCASRIHGDSDVVASLTDLKSPAVEVHDDGSRRPKPLLHKDSRGRHCGADAAPDAATADAATADDATSCRRRQHVAAVDEVLVHVLREVHKERRFLLVLLR